MDNVLHWDVVDVDLGICLWRRGFVGMFEVRSLKSLLQSKLRMFN